MTRDNPYPVSGHLRRGDGTLRAERGIRGSEARHVDQHEYYRQCQIRKKDLEQDVAGLSAEKERSFDTETQSWRNARKSLNEATAGWTRHSPTPKPPMRNDPAEQRSLKSASPNLSKKTPSLAATNTALSDEKKRLMPTGRKSLTRLPTSRADKSKLIEERSACAKERRRRREKRKRQPCRKRRKRKRSAIPTAKDALS